MADTGDTGPALGDSTPKGPSPGVERVDHASSDPDSDSSEGTPPPLPPRQKTRPRTPTRRPESPEGSQRLSNTATRTPTATRPALLGKATTALSVADVHIQAHGNEQPPLSPRRFGNVGLPSGLSRRGSDADETVSVRSLAPTTEAGMDVESILGEVLDKDNPAWRSLTPKVHAGQTEDALFSPDPDFQDAFEREFDELDDITSDGLNEEAVLDQWKSKLKQYFILSRAGKPIWSRHGNDQLVTSYVGVILTLISFYEGAKDALKGFTTDGARFAVLSKGSLHLLAISRLGESDQQLRGQLEAMYMQILSTLTLPVMERMFKNRASTDLRRPLQGTEKLLSALADGFTRGSPSTLLSALECLKMRKAHRNLINNTLLKTRSDNLLYGLIVAGGRLVSVIRPRKHSLHPGDLHLIFNMLFEAGGVKAGGGENWIPLCLPGFNNTGYLYMYISFLNLEDPSEELGERPPSSHTREDEVAIILISANKESFFELRQMKADLIEKLRHNGSLEVIRSSVKSGRASCTEIVPNSVIRHFLYKSRNNVQFIMPSLEPHFCSAISRRRLFNTYTHLHTSMHSRPAHPKIHHSSTTAHTALAWSTPLFELYALAPANTARAALSQAANRLLQYVRREEERIFIIGGAVF